MRVADGLGIQEVARQSGVPPSALRYYEDIGLIPAPPRVSGRRRYDAGVLDRLRVITSAQRAGLTLAEVGELLAGMTAGGGAQRSWREMATRKLPEIAGLIEELRGMQRLLEGLASCECRDLSQCAAVLRACPGPGSAGSSAQRGCG
ncbi:MAG TPA: MerR family transcriptional regulator [Acidimicrobiales bacterium]|nr:MerR family transcriptional regulator [Acidimicrobiales bacterium]